MKIMLLRRIVLVIAFKLVEAVFASLSLFVMIRFGGLLTNEATMAAGSLSFQENLTIMAYVLAVISTYFVGFLYVPISLIALILSGIIWRKSIAALALVNGLTYAAHSSIVLLLLGETPWQSEFFEFWSILLAFNLVAPVLLFRLAPFRAWGND